MRDDFVILGSLLSEKAYRNMEKNSYVLKVALNANKDQIREALKTSFGVDAVSVRTSVLRGKIVRRARSKKSGAMYVKLPNTKKAFVTLKAGQNLPVITTAEKSESV